MKSIILHVMCLFLLLAVVPAQAQNLMGSNSGFDDQTTVSLTLTDQITYNDPFIQWRVYSVGGHTAEAQVTADATAPSAPNVFEMSTTSGAWLNEVIHSWPSNPMGLTGGNYYKFSFWARGMDVSTDHIFTVLSFYNADGNYSGGEYNIQTNHALTTDWQKFEVLFVMPSGPSGVDPQFSSDLTAWDFQLDSVSIEDITTGNYALNGGFESSATSTPYWTAAAAGGRDFAAQLVTDAAEGSQAAVLSQSANLEAGTDGVLNGDQFPWNGSDEMIIALKIKDVPTIAMDEYAFVVLAAFDSTGTWLGNISMQTFEPGNGDFAYYTYTVDNLPAETAKVNLAVRISDVSGAAVAGDFIVDDIRIGNVTAGTTVPAQLTGFELE